MVAWFKMENYYSGADLRGNPRWPSVDPAPYVSPANSFPILDVHLGLQCLRGLYQHRRLDDTDLLVF